MQTLRNWNGDKVTFAESKGGVLAFVDPLAGLLRGGVQEWPPPEIERKLSRSGRQRAYSGENLDAVVEKLGYYSDLQSINSEDAITWSVFGPLIYAPEITRVKFCTRLFHMIDLPLLPPKSATISLWPRKLHPHTMRSGGPEIDFLVETPEVVIVGEAKWRSPVGTSQGIDKDKNQIEIRQDFLKSFGRRDYPTVTTFVVLGVYLNEPFLREQNSQLGDAKILLRNVSWEAVCNINPHPTEEELPRYFQWKKMYSK